MVLRQAAQAAVVDEHVARCEHCFQQVPPQQLKRCSACKHPRYCSQPCQARPLLVYARRRAARRVQRGA